jgi:hypothetical protein
LNKHNPFAIVAAMKRTLILAALAAAFAVPMFAQSTEFGVLVGGSRRFVKDAPRLSDDDLLDSNFSLSNNAVDLYWAMQIEPDTFLKLKVGRIESPVAYVSGQDASNPPRATRADAEGEIQHAEANVEYRFSEPYGSTGIFGGIGFYRASAADADARTNFGWNAGLSGDFPLSRRYGVIVEGTYHWTGGEFRERFVTLEAGLRVSF